MPLKQTKPNKHEHFANIMTNISITDRYNMHKFHAFLYSVEERVLNE